MRTKTLTVILSGILLFSACKKEPVQSPTNNPPAPEDTLTVYTNYPDNFLKTGNYWVYTIYQFDSITNTFVPSPYTDSAFVEGMDLSSPGDTFYKINHVRGSGWGTYTYPEYWKLTADGLYKNRLGEEFNFIDLPAISDSMQKSFKGTYSWTGYTSKDSIAYIKTECCLLPAGVFEAFKVVDDNPSITVGNKTAYFARGIGIVKYTRSEMWNGAEQWQLIRFKVQL